MKKKHSTATSDISSVSGKFRVGKKKDGVLVGDVSPWYDNHIGDYGMRYPSLNIQSSHTVQRALTSDFEYEYVATTTASMEVYTSGSTTARLTGVSNSTNFAAGDKITFANGAIFYVNSSASSGTIYGYLAHQGDLVGDITSLPDFTQLVTDMAYTVISGSGTPKLAGNEAVPYIASESIDELLYEYDFDSPTASLHQIFSILFVEATEEAQVYGINIRAGSSAGNAVSLIKIPAPITVYEGEQLYVEYTYTYATSIMSPTHYDWNDIGGNPINFFCDTATSDGTTITLKTTGDLDFLVEVGDEVQLRASTSVVHNLLSITPVASSHATIIVDSPTDWQVGDEVNVAGTGISDYDDVMHIISTVNSPTSFDTLGVFLSTAVAGTAKFNVVDSFLDGVYIINAMPDTKTIEILDSANLRNGTGYVEETGGVTIQSFMPRHDYVTPPALWNNQSVDTNMHMFHSPTEVYSVDPVTKRISDTVSFRYTTPPAGFTYLSSNDIQPNYVTQSTATGISSSTITIGALHSGVYKQMILTYTNITQLATLITFDKPIPKLLDYKMSFSWSRRMHSEFHPLDPLYPFT